MDTSSLRNSFTCPKYTSTFLNQLQSEWNEFVLEISHSTPHDVMPDCNAESSKKHNTKAAFIESLNKFNRTSGGNIFIPVPLSTLKKLFSPSKQNVDDIFKSDFFNEIKENLNLTQLSCKKLQQLLSIDESSELSDFPSPSLPTHFRNSAPPNLFPVKKSKSKPKKPAIIISEKRIGSENNGNSSKKPNSTSDAKFKTANGNDNMPSNNGDRHMDIFNARDSEEKVDKIGEGNILENKIKIAEIVKEPANDKGATIGFNNNNNIQQINGSDSSSLFYTFKQPKKSSKPTIVCTYFSQTELSKMYQIVKKLGFFDIENYVSSRTTHLVSGGTNKTINLCKAVARGCWILDKEWITNSNDANRWLLEERFEKKSLSPAVQENRLKRQKSGSTYRCDVFFNCDSMYVSSKCSQPSVQDLKELILLGSGRLEESPERASYIIGPMPKYQYVKEIWILNCMLQGHVVDVNKYIKNKSKK